MDRQNGEWSFRFFFRGPFNDLKSGHLRAAGIAPENEIGRSNQTKPRPQVIRSQWMFHIQEREKRENDHGDYLLNHLKLTQAEMLRADPVGGHLQGIFKKGDTPTDHDNYEQRIGVHVL